MSDWEFNEKFNTGIFNHPSGVFDLRYFPPMFEEESLTVVVMLLKCT
jgi:hypothetical protein